MFRSTILIFCLLLLANCSSVVYLPSSTGQTPVVGGGLWRGKAGLDVSNAVPVTVINDITTSPTTRDEIKVGVDENIIGEISGLTSLAGSRLDLGLGILERLDIYWTGAFGARYQVIGSEKSDWKMTVFAGIYQNDDRTTTGTAPDTVYSANIRIKGYEIGTSMGKELSDSALVYLTLASRGGSASIQVTQDDVETERYNDDLEHYIGTLGFLFGETWYLKLEASFNHIAWSGSDALGVGISDSGTEFGGGLGFGYQW